MWRVFANFVGMMTTDIPDIPRDREPAAAPRVLFVCLGNICRSPAAKGVMRRVVDDAARRGVISRYEADSWAIDSAGTGRWHIGQLPDRRMRVHARQRGYELTHHARQVSTADFGRFDLIIGMDSANCADLRAMAPTPEAEAKVVPMAAFFSPGSRYDHVPDPYYEGSEGFELVLDQLEDGCRNLAEELRKKN